MKRDILNSLTKSIMLFMVCVIPAGTYGANSPAQDELRRNYEFHCTHSSDIYEHVHVLRDLAKHCSTVTEIGLRTMNSTWGILQGLSENPADSRVYIGIDLEHPPSDIFNSAKRLAEANDISFFFVNANDMAIDIDPTELLFIDSMHTYCHLTYELEKFSSKVTKYIAMHDTDEPWGFIDDFQQYHGDKSEYPPEIDRNKYGLWQAVLDFLEKHPEWTLHERRLNNHGFTILKRA